MLDNRQSNGRHEVLRLPRFSGQICSWVQYGIDPPLSVESRVVHGRVAGRLSRP
jgi:hypothetical protein